MSFEKDKKEHDYSGHNPTEEMILNWQLFRPCGNLGKAYLKINDAKIITVQRSIDFKDFEIS